jgi:hypothetical protein
VPWFRRTEWQMAMGDNGAECESKFMAVTLRKRSTRATGCCGPWRPSRPGARRQPALHPRVRIAPDACILNTMNQNMRKQMYEGTGDSDIKTKLNL